MQAVWLQQVHHVKCQARRLLRTISGLPVALSWKRPPETALSKLPLSQNSDSSHVSCNSTHQSRGCLGKLRG